MYPERDSVCSFCQGGINAALGKKPERKIKMEKSRCRIKIDKDTLYGFLKQCQDEQDVYQTLRILYGQTWDITDSCKWMKWITEYVAADRTGMVSTAATLLGVMLLEEREFKQAAILADRFTMAGRMPQSLIQAHIPGTTWTETVWSLTQDQQPSFLFTDLHRVQQLQLSFLPGSGINQPVYDLVPQNNLYIYKHIDGCWVLLAIMDKNVPVLANEKSSDNRLPSYYTAGESFVSPVAWMQKAAQEWQTVIESTKFVRTPLRMQLYLPHSGAKIVNIDEMMAGPWSELDLQVLDRSDVHEQIRSVMLYRFPLSQEWQRIVSMVRERII